MIKDILILNKQGVSFYDLKYRIVMWAESKNMPITIIENQALYIGKGSESYLRMVIKFDSAEDATIFMLKWA